MWRGTYDIKYHKVVIDPEFLERAEQDPTRGSIETRHTLLVDGFHFFGHGLGRSKKCGKRTFCI